MELLEDAELEPYASAAARRGSLSAAMMRNRFFKLFGFLLGFENRTLYTCLRQYFMMKLSLRTINIPNLDHGPEAVHDENLQIFDENVRRFRAEMEFLDMPSWSRLEPAGKRLDQDCCKQHLDVV